MGAFSAPLAALDVERIILVAPMIPALGETPGEWWTHVAVCRDAGAPPFDPSDTFFHDVPPEVCRRRANGRAQAGGPAVR